MPPIFNGNCTHCGICIDDCPGDILRMTDSGPAVLYPDECWHCGNCRISCPSGAVNIKFPLSMLV
jgi:NAD-dependent dihydropyrimidine dehydrogenase PreA subunit